MGQGRVEREKSLDRQIRAFQWVRGLCVLPGRVAGGAGERAAAVRASEWLTELGFEEVVVTPAPGGPRPTAAAALHLGLGALGCTLGGWLGALLATAAAISSSRERTRGETLLSRLLPAPTTRTAVARAGARRPWQRVVLHARLDAASTNPLSTRFGSGLGRPARRPHLLPALLLPAAAGLAAASALGVEGGLLGVLRFGVASLLAVGAAGMLAWALAPGATGANDATGPAALLTCAEQLLAQLGDDTELWVVASGAGPAGAGLTAFCAEHADWPRESTLLLEFDRVGSGTLHWVRRPDGGRGAASPVLVELARRVAAAGAFGEISAADPVHPPPSRAVAAQGFPTLSLVGLSATGLPVVLRADEDTPERIDPHAIVRAADFAAAVARAALRGEAGPIAIV